MFAVIWFVLAVAGGEVTALEMREHRNFPDEPACRAHIERYRARIPDLVRGHIGAGFDDEVRADGRCVPSGDPT